MRQVIERSKDGEIELEIETVFIVRGGANKPTMQYHSPIEATLEFGKRAVCHGAGKNIAQQGPQ